MRQRFDDLVELSEPRGFRSWPFQEAAPGTHLLIPPIGGALHKDRAIAVHTATGQNPDRAGSLRGQGGKGRMAIGT